MWQRFKRLFKKPVDWASGSGDEATATLHTCPGCDTPKPETDFDLDERWRVLCLTCRQSGHPRKAYESYDDLVPAAPEPPKQEPPSLTGVS